MPRNRLSNDRFRQLLGVDPIAFWSASLRLCGYDLPDEPCRDEWLRLSSQRAGTLNHEDLSLAIQQAEQEIERVLGHPLGPAWLCERHVPRTFQGNCTSAFKLAHKPTAFGQKNSQMVAEVELDRLFETVKIQPFNAVFHSKYAMQWETPEHRLWKISINGTEHNVSHLRHKADLQRWLNGLGLGNWYVSQSEPLQPFADSDYDNAPIPTIEAPPTVTIDYIITYSHAECCRKRIHWNYDGHVISGTWHNSRQLGFTTIFQLDDWLDGLGVGNWGVFNGELEALTDTAVLLIPDQPTEPEVYGTLNVTAEVVNWQSKLVINGIYYDNSSLTDEADIRAFLMSVGLGLKRYDYQPHHFLIENPNLIPIHTVVAPNLEPPQLFGLIKDTQLFGPSQRPYAYRIEDLDGDGYYETAIITGNAPGLQACELQVYPVDVKRNGQPDEAVQIRPIEVTKYDPRTGDFEIEIPTYLLIKPELTHQRPRPYDDPFPVDLCCASDDTDCDPIRDFYLSNLEIWRVWHDNTLPSVVFRHNNSCGKYDVCRTGDNTGCINPAEVNHRWVYPKLADYRTVEIPDGYHNFFERDSWQWHGCFSPAVASLDIHYFFDPCADDCAGCLVCPGELCSKFERAVFMLAAARLWDLCPCGCEENRLRTFQREAGKDFQSHSYEAQTVIVSAGKIGDTREYPFGTRYGEVEAWRQIRQYILYEANVGHSVI